MFTPENDLERSLVKATTDPSHRPQFLRDLLASDIFIMRYGDEPTPQGGTLPKGTKIGILPWNRGGIDWLPMFSSQRRLEENLTEPGSYLQMKARDFLELTNGAHVILNPNCEYGKEFLPDEIAKLLDGSMFLPTHTEVVQKETPVMIGEPAEYPTELVEALSKLFAKHPNVKAAHLAHYMNPETGEPAHSLIGLEVEGDSEVVIGEAGMVAGGVVGPTEIVDFIRVERDDRGISQFFLDRNKPFYRRPAWRGLFR